MKKIVYYFLSLSAILCLSTSCNEDLSMVEFVEQKPVVESFSPMTGMPGTTVTIKGQYLNRVNRVTIGEGDEAIDAPILSKTNDKHIEITIPAGGVHGKITVYNNIGSTSSTDTYTYVYPTPVVNKYPADGDVASVVVFFGEYMNAITSVTFVAEAPALRDADPEDFEGEIVLAKHDELAVRIPNILVGGYKVSFGYKTDDGDKSIAGTDVISVTKTAPILNTDGLITSANTGDKITIRGRYLEKIDSVMLGKSKLQVARITPDGLSMDLIFPDDKYNYLGGENKLALNAYGIYNTEFSLVPEFTITTPKVLVYKDRRVEAGQDKGNTGKFFFNFEEGDAGSGEYWRSLDKVAYSRKDSGGSCSAANTLKKAPAVGGITEKEYKSVQPYFYVIYISSCQPIICPAGVNSLFKSVNAPAGVNSSDKATTTTMFGTPLVMYRTLNPNVAAEKSLIDKVHSGAIADEHISAAMIKDMDFSTATGPGDKYSNALYFSHGALSYGGRTSGARPFAGAYTAAQTNLGTPELKRISTPESLTEGSNVLLFIYYTYNYDKAMPTENISKIGFVEITGLCTGGPVILNEEGKETSNGKTLKNAYYTMNVYWQRTPEGGW